MAWERYYHGDGTPRPGVRLPDPPRWRSFPRSSAGKMFLPPEGLVDVVNAALRLRRPLLITGAPGSGKSTVIEQVAQELNLGQVFRWHITSQSSLPDALYRYDALGRIHAQRLRPDTLQEDSIASFLQLGPLGSALAPADRPRALLVDEIDKSDLDLPGDLLEVLERGEFEIPELVRENDDADVDVRLWDSEQTSRVVRGRVQCTEFPFIVLTSNGEQEMSAPFLRRCLRFEMPRPSPDMLRGVIRGWLGMDVVDDSPAAALIAEFVRRVEAGEKLAVDQLLSTVYLLVGEGAPEGEQRERLAQVLMRNLSGV